jgi:hypothetical protein
MPMVSDFNENWYLCYFEVRNWLVMMKFAFRVIYTRPPISKWLIEIRKHWNFAGFVGGQFDTKNDPECNIHHYQSIPHFKITLDINFHWNRRPLTIWRFCWQPCEELIGNDDICIQGHFYESTIFKMDANKIVKLAMVSDFNENW